MSWTSLIKKHMTVDMINTKNMYGSTDVLSKALNASWMRNEVINNNIANIDTPGYKRQDVVFEDYFRNAMASNKGIDRKTMLETQAKVIRDNSSLSYRLDGNNVDMDTEMSYLAMNQLKYNTLTEQINYNFSRLKAVLK